MQGLDFWLGKIECTGLEMVSGGEIILCWPNGDFPGANARRIY